MLQIKVYQQLRGKNSIILNICMLEKFKEFRKDFSERIRSPFISALIISWSIYNWKIYYLMFYSSEVISLEKRIASIQCYLCRHTKWELIWGPVCTAFLGLVLLNVFKSIGLGISLLYENWASPFIQKWLYNDKIVEKYKHEILQRQYNRLREELNEKESVYVQNEQEIKNLEGNFRHYQFNSIPTRGGNLNEVFDPEYEWVNEYFDSKTQLNGTIKFTNESSGIKEENRDVILQIDNIKISDNGFIVMFEKIFPDDKRLLNILIRDKDDNYSGIENGTVKITYKKGIKKKKYEIS